MGDELDFYNDINELSQNIDKTKLNIKLNLQLYDNANIIDTILKWKTCFEILGRKDLFMTPKIQKIIFCLLSDCGIINYINNNENTNLALYDTINESFWGFNCIDNDNRFIKIKLFNVCDKMIVVDMGKYPVYKIYYLYNLSVVKNFYGSQKVNFDTIIKDISLEPVFIGNINNLKDDYKKLSVSKFELCNKQYIDYIKSYTKLNKKLNTQITNIMVDIYGIKN